MASFLENAFDSSVDTIEMAELLSTYTITKKVVKGQVLLNEGEVSTKAYFVLSGCLRMYFVDDKGKEHIYMFAPEGWTLSDLDAQVNNKPSRLIIDAIEDSEVQEFDDALFNKILSHAPHLAGGSVTKFMRRIAVLQKRIIMLMSASALERYQDFLETYPDIVQRVPQKMIASYLGITPEALSRIRSDMAKQKSPLPIS